MATRAESVIDLAVPAPVAFEVACAALAAGKHSITGVDRNVGMVWASSSANLASWGENLELQIRPVSQDASQVVIRSSLKFGLVDWGRNNKNVVLIEKAIREQLSVGPVAPPPPMAAAVPPPAPVPAPAQPAESPAGWHADPSGRHHHRWWDGTRWTDAVSTNGTTSTDPLGTP